MEKISLEVLKKASKWFFEALFPEKCLVCRKEGAYLCSDHYKFMPAPKNEVHFQYLDHIYAATAYYQGGSEVVIEYFKFKGFKDLGEVMSEQMSGFLSDPRVEGFVLMPIPLHWTRLVWRGFNQSAVLAYQLQQKTPSFVVSQGLKRRKRTSQQARLDKHARKKNMEDAFVWKGDFPLPQKILLIDDVVASGATLDMATKELKKQGVKEVYALVFARGGGKAMNN